MLRTHQILNTHMHITFIQVQYVFCIYICSIPKGGYIPVGQIPVHMTGNESSKKNTTTKANMGKCLNHRTGQTPIENENDTKRYAWMCLCIYCYVQLLLIRGYIMYIYTVIAFAMKAYLISQTSVRHLVFYTFFPSVILCSNRTNCRFVLVSHSNTNAQIHLQLQTSSLIYHMYTSLYIHLYFELKVNESMSLW